MIHLSEMTTEDIELVREKSPTQKALVWRIYTRGSLEQKNGMFQRSRELSPFSQQEYSTREEALADFRKTIKATKSHLKPSSINTFLLLGCGKQKSSTEVEARELYTGSISKARVAYAEKLKLCHRQIRGYGFVSAHYGFLHPTEKVKPYDLRLSDLNEQEKAHWREGFAKQFAVQVFERWGKTINHIEVHAGAEYVEQVTLAIQEYNKRYLTPLTVFVTAPMAGLGIGEQLGWYKKANSITPKHPMSCPEGYLQPLLQATPMLGDALQSRATGELFHVVAIETGDGIPRYLDASLDKANAISAKSFFLEWFVLRPFKPLPMSLRHLYDKQRSDSDSYYQIKEENGLWSVYDPQGKIFPAYDVLPDYGFESESEAKAFLKKVRAVEEAFFSSQRWEKAFISSSVLERGYPLLFSPLGFVKWKNDGTIYSLATFSRKNPRMRILPFSE